MVNRDYKGSMPERLMGVDCKSTGYAYAGSNPARPTTIFIEVQKAKLAFWILPL
jgi:hypothetical protein